LPKAHISNLTFSLCHFLKARKYNTRTKAVTNQRNWPFALQHRNQNIFSSLSFQLQLQCNDN